MADQHEELQAWICDPKDGIYVLGIIKDDLGWVSESNLQVMAERRTDRIFFFVRMTKTEVSTDV